MKLMLSKRYYNLQRQQQQEQQEQHEQPDQQVQLQTTLHIDR